MVQIGHLLSVDDDEDDIDEDDNKDDQNDVDDNSDGDGELYKDNKLQYIYIYKDNHYKDYNRKIKTSIFVLLYGIGVIICTHLKVNWSPV